MFQSVKQAQASTGSSLGMRAMGVLLALALAATMTILPAQQAHAADTTTLNVPVTYAQKEAREMLPMINDFRASNAKCWNKDNTEQVAYGSLPALSYDYKLEQTAMLRAAELAVSFSHTRPNGTMCFTAFPPLYGYGENIAFGYPTKSSVFTAWREDNYKYEGQGHRRNMLDSDFTSVGIGHAVFNGTHMWVQNFGTPNSGAAATAADNSAKMVAVEVANTAIKSNSLTLPYTKLTLKKGASKALPKANAKITFNSYEFNNMSYAANATWTSSKPSIVTISGGKAVAKKPGKAVLKASLNGKTASLTVTVSPTAPSKPALQSAKSTAKKKATVKWKKATKKQLANITGYEIVLSTSKNFKSGVVKKTASKSKTSLTVKGLKSNKKYYVHVRAVNKVNGVTAYSAWSKTLTVKVR